MIYDKRISVGVPFRHGSVQSAIARAARALSCALCVMLAIVAPPAVADTAAGSGGKAAGAIRTPDSKVTFQPHRAVYDISLAEASGSSGVTGLTGRMVYELTGSSCEGYTQNMRFVTEMINENGADTFNDLQTSSWEDGDGNRLRFSSSQKQNKALPEVSQGDAVRADDNINVDLAKPEDKSFALPASVYFPIQHASLLIDAGRRGERLFSANLFDGGEKGEKYYATLAVIGETKRGSADVVKIEGDGKALEGLRYWPVTMSYFDPSKGEEDQLPVYELGFAFYENGVTSSLTINYGEFSIAGKLRQLEVFKPTACGTAQQP